MTVKLGTKAHQVLLSLRSNAEDAASPEGWRTVYLDNARPRGMSARSFAGYLSALEREGVYQPIDNFAWGKVQVNPRLRSQCIVTNCSHACDCVDDTSAGACR
jgi:hypothetical protein